MSEQFDKHDAHYRSIESKKGVQPIEKIELTVQTLITNGVEPARAYDLAAGVKYLLRSGEKTGESEEKEFSKFLNYAVRSLTGHWIDQ